jgi:hypothetical protein
MNSVEPFTAPPVRDHWHEFDMQTSMSVRLTRKPYQLEDLSNTAMKPVRD